MCIEGHPPKMTYHFRTVTFSFWEDALLVAAYSMKDIDPCGSMLSADMCLYSMICLYIHTMCTLYVYIYIYIARAHIPWNYPSVWQIQVLPRHPSWHGERIHQSGLDKGMKARFLWIKWWTDKVPAESEFSELDSRHWLFQIDGSVVECEKSPI